MARVPTVLVLAKTLIPIMGDIAVMDLANPLHATIFSQQFLIIRHPIIAKRKIPTSRDTAKTDRVLTKRGRVKQMIQHLLDIAKQMQPAVRLPERARVKQMITASPAIAVPAQLAVTKIIRVKQKILTAKDIAQTENVMATVYATQTTTANPAIAKITPYVILPLSPKQLIQLKPAILMDHLVAIFLKDTTAVMRARKISHTLILVFAKQVMAQRQATAVIQIIPQHVLTNWARAKLMIQANRGIA